jgi:outer membrane lipoprotein LolB
VIPNTSGCFGSVVSSRNDAIRPLFYNTDLNEMPAGRCLLALRSVLLAGLVLAGLAGCAALPGVADDPVAARSAFAERSVALEEVSQWRLAGRLTLELPAETWTGQVGWRAEDSRQVIDLSGPMGRGGGRLMLGGHQAVLVTRDGERYEASDPDALMALITGRAMPVSGLAYWVRGMARPGAGFDLRAERNGRPVRLIQDGWEIVYGAFEDVGAAAMPASLELSREDVRLRLLIQRWQLGPAPVS